MTELNERLTLRQSTMKDYAALAPFHYLHNRPCGTARVFVLQDNSETVGERFKKLHDHSSGATPRCSERCVRTEEGLHSAHIDPQSRAEMWHPRNFPQNSPRNPPPIAVLVESYPVLSCSLRNRATADRYAGWKDRAAAARLLNDELRCISRVIVHPQWRGLGLAVRLVQHALATATTPLTEALAAMGRVHPFFELAGMTKYQRWPHAKDQRLRDALTFAGVQPWQLASSKRMQAVLEDSALLREEIHRWAGRGLSLAEALAKARDGLLCEPVYYLKANDGKND